SSHTARAGPRSGRGRECRREGPACCAAPMSEVPGSLLENDAVAVGVFEGQAFALPVGIGGGDRMVSMPAQARHRLCPGDLVRQVEDQEMFLAGCIAGGLL